MWPCLKARAREVRGHRRPARGVDTRGAVWASRCGVRPSPGRDSGACVQPGHGSGKALGHRARERSEGRGRRRRGRVRGQQLRKPSLPAVGPQTCFLSPSWEPDIRGHSVTRRALLPLLAPGLSRCPQARGQAPRMSASHHGASPRVCVPKSPSRGHGCGTRATLPPCDLMRNQSHPRRPFPSEVPFQLLGGRDF